MFDFSILTETTFGLIYMGVFGLIFGAVIASFLCVTFERIPRGETINGRSHCICGRQLKAVENIPIVSWLALRGEAKCCGSKIPVFYVLAELYLGLAWCAAGLLVQTSIIVAVLTLVASTAGLVGYGVRRAKTLAAN